MPSFDRCPPLTLAPFPCSCQCLLVGLRCLAYLPILSPTWVKKVETLSSPFVWNCSRHRVICQMHQWRAGTHPFYTVTKERIFKRIPEVNFMMYKHNIIYWPKKRLTEASIYFNSPSLPQKNELTIWIKLPRYLFICGILEYMNLGSKLHCEKCGLEQSIQQVLLLFRDHQTETLVSRIHIKRWKHVCHEMSQRKAPDKVTSGYSAWEMSRGCVDHSHLDTFLFSLAHRIA